ncbi:MAG: hypothetical protein HP492_06575 [Nitrospira sp.]|nr:hypothetical protein [Nitrospira sp.]
MRGQPGRDVDHTGCGQEGQDKRADRVKNPYFVPELKSLAGDDPRVRAFVLSNSDAVALIERLEGLLKFLIPQFEREPRSYLTIAIGCTGGRHRSVAVAGRLQEGLSAIGYDVALKHRDIHKS